MTLIEAEESRNCEPAASHELSGWNTSIDESLKDEIRVTVVATGVRQDKVERVGKLLHSQRPYKTGPWSLTPKLLPFDREFDFETRCLELPAALPVVSGENQTVAQPLVIGIIGKYRHQTEPTSTSS